MRYNPVAGTLQIEKTAEYEKWFRKLRDRTAKARINIRLRKIELEGRIVGECKPVGDEVLELVFDMGPGYRVYVTKEEDVLLILLLGGDKSTQGSDIRRAKSLAREWRSG